MEGVMRIRSGVLPRAGPTRNPRPEPGLWQQDPSFRLQGPPGGSGLHLLARPGTRSREGPWHSRGPFAPKPPNWGLSFISHSSDVTRAREGQKGSWGEGGGQREQRMLKMGKGVPQGEKEGELKAKKEKGRKGTGQRAGGGGGGGKKGERRCGEQGRKRSL